MVDHKVPHKGDKKLFWDSKNWQPMCKSHHDAKTAREDMGAW
ncbi:HNH endonuclease signature motif containing protein [Alicyclobacillus fodiniaquatilis]|uniref:HNH endonuclease signature motif containing protein n=1 Tax=Alicyclobacillus fodiniaquatilis TaxID=1661150 RepID=A0ABW4JGW2_9BACL